MPSLAVPADQRDHASEARLRPPRRSGALRSALQHGADGIEFFAEMADGKQRDEPLFKPARLEADNDWDPDEPDERIWHTHLWGRRVRAAVEKHNEMVSAEAGKGDGMSFHR
jgi:hypothetical protein